MLITNATNRAINLNAGPATLPDSVLEKAQSELMNYKGSGMSVMELSHRSAEFDEVRNNAEANLRSLYQIPDDYDVLFLQGGASLQFAMIPMNLATADGHIEAINTGAWTQKAISEINTVSKTTILATGEADNFLKLPSLSEITPSGNADYLHLTSNNTIFGTQFSEFPNTGSTPLVADMSSDILSRPLAISDFGIIFAGAQKNIGPSGLAITIIRKDLVEKGNENIPKFLQFRTHAKANSLYNTPPTFGIYMANLVFEWIQDQGGLSVIAEKNAIKAKLLYDAIDNNDYYYSPVEENSRSKMNVVFRISGNDADAEAALVKEAKANHIIGLKGHRSVGGLRASIYNAQSLQNIEALIDFLEHFAKR